jgi:hypothetical protein
MTSARMPPMYPKPHPVPHGGRRRDREQHRVVLHARDLTDDAADRDEGDPEQEVDRVGLHEEQPGHERDEQTGRDREVALAPARIGSAPEHRGEQPDEQAGGCDAETQRAREPGGGALVEVRSLAGVDRGLGEEVVARQVERDEDEREDHRVERLGRPVPERPAEHLLARDDPALLQVETHGRDGTGVGGGRRGSGAGSGLLCGVGQLRPPLRVLHAPHPTGRA